jgi:hypothetical protein
MAAVNSDGVACLALVTISLASSIVGYASLWSPQLMKRNSLINVPPGDVVIRTREGAFVVVKCDENVSRELYTGTEECVYKVQKSHMYRALVAAGTFFLMVSVVLLGNCNFPQQLAIGVSYIVLNGLYWGTSLFKKERFWNMDLYNVERLTNNDKYPEYLRYSNAHEGNTSDTDPEKQPSFTRTMWYAIRETKEAGWVKKSGAAPMTNEWESWLKEAEVAAKDPLTRDTWPAVTIKNQKVRQLDPSSPVTAQVDEHGIMIPGGQEAPEMKVPPRERI